MPLSDDAARYWLNKPIWNDNDAAWLLPAIDPREPVPIQLRNVIGEKERAILKRLMAYGFARSPRSPAEWVEAARALGFTIPQNLKPRAKWENWGILKAAGPLELAALSLDVEPRRIAQDGPYT